MYTITHQNNFSEVVSQVARLEKLITLLSPHIFNKPFEYEHFESPYFTWVNDSTEEYSVRRIFTLQGLKQYKEFKNLLKTLRDTQKEMDEIMYHTRVDRKHFDNRDYESPYYFWYENQQNDFSARRLTFEGCRLYKCFKLLNEVLLKVKDISTN